MKVLRAQLWVLQHVVGNGQAPTQEYSPRLRILELYTYEVENFLFDMERYFFVASIEDKVRNVLNATMYLDGDAKLWW